MFDEVLKKYEDFINFLCRPIRKNHDDFVQELKIYLFEIQDKSHEQILNMLQYKLASLKRQYKDGIIYSSNPPDSIYMEQDFGIIDDLLEILTGNARAVCVLLSEGARAKEIKEKLKLSQRQYYKAIRTIKNALKKAEHLY